MNATRHEEYVAHIRNGFQHLSEGLCERALELATAASKMDPGGAEALFLLGLTAFKLNDIGRAIELIEKAHGLDPDCREYVDALAVLLTKVGRLDDSLYFGKLATACEPHRWLSASVPGEFKDYYTALRTVTPSPYPLMAYEAYGLRQFEQCVEYAERGLRADSRQPDCYRILGKALYELGEFDRAVAAFHALFHLQEPKTDDWLALGDCLLKQGRFEEADTLFRRMVESDPETLAVRSRLMARLTYYPEPQWRTFFDQLALWNERARAGVTGDLAPEPGRLRKGKGLRIGYILDASEFNPMIPFIEPLLQQFDTGRFEVFCYQQNVGEDIVGTRLRLNVDDWREINEIDDETVAAIVSGDEIDVLVDLNGHSEATRLGVFAHHAAPVQISWLGQPTGAGAVGVDYVVSDAVTRDDDALLAGTTRCLTLESGLVALAPRQVFETWPEPSPSPADSAGFVTFGATCDLSCLNPDVAMTWARILRQLPRAQLYLGNVRCIPRDIGDRAISLFAHFGVADRVQFHEPPPGQDVSADFFARVDVFLDTHPVSNFFDVCKALWMGVPAIARKGGRRSALMGASVLRAAGKPEWIAESDEAYIERAVTLGSLPYALAAVRRNLRGAVEGSPLCDTQGFVRAMERVYRQAWDETVDAQK